ncbi:MAG: heterodisulfide reductase-related iron-sulfur binding cluster [Planctomycetota bacterium]
MNDRLAEEARLRYEKTLDCVHCGLCLSQCPTYELTGNEAAGPRGRIHLMRALSEGRIEPDDAFREKMDLCLVCRACESVCPSGVEFGRMMEITRHEMNEARPPGRLARFLLRRIVPSPRGLAVAAGLTRFARLTGLLALARGLGRLGLLPRRWRAAIAAAPPVPSSRHRRPLGARHPAASPPVETVAFLEGCVMRPLFGDVNRAAVDALTASGRTVLVPEGQTCCGALHAHAGDLEGARALVERNLEAFEAALDEGATRIVLDSAGCGAAMIDWPAWFPEDDPRRARAAEISARVVDLATLLASDGFAPRGAARFAGRRATWDAPCHLHHAQRRPDDAPALLARVPGLEIVPLPGADTCCGSAGVYNLTQPEMSDRILEEKLDRLAETGADLLVTANPGCMLQWRRGIARRGLAVEVVHLAELL